MGRLERFNEFLARHLWVQFVLSTIFVYGVLMLALPGRSPVGTLVRLVFSSLGAMGVVIARRNKDKRVAGGTTDDVVSLEHRIRHGDVPTEPKEREAMRALIAQRLHRARHRRAAGVFLVLMTVAVVTMSAFTLSPRATIGYAVVMTGCFGYVLVSGNTVHHRMVRMRDALGGPAS